jgi:hypothetical protein
MKKVYKHDICSIVVAFILVAITVLFTLDYLGKIYEFFQNQKLFENTEILGWSIVILYIIVLFLITTMIYHLLFEFFDPESPIRYIILIGFGIFIHIIIVILIMMVFAF